MQNNNKGFSLVELLISITILTIIVIPVLDNIVLSSRMNKNSRDKQNVTMLTGNLLESTKVEQDVSSIAKDLLYPDTDTYANLFAGAETDETYVRQMQKDGDAYEEVTTPCVIQDGDDYVFTETQDKSYTFAVENLSVNNKSYDALITYDASAYTGEGQDKSINDQEMPVISSVATKENAVISQGYSDTWAASSLKHSYNQWFNTFRTGDNEITNEIIEQNMTRQFLVTASYNEAKKKYVVDGTIIYTLSDSVIPVASEYDSYRQFENKVFHSEFETLSNVYLFYKPDFTHNRDRITVDNQLPKGKAEFTFQLVAQAEQDQAFEEAMKGYGVDFTLKESAKQTGTGQANSYTKIKNNVGLEDSSKTINKIECINADTIAFHGIVEKETKTRLYEVTVAVYAGNSNKKYEEEKRLTTMTSTKGVE